MSHGSGVTSWFISSAKSFTSVFKSSWTGSSKNSRSPGSRAIRFGWSGAMTSIGSGDSVVISGDELSATSITSEVVCLHMFVFTVSLSSDRWSEQCARVAVRGWDDTYGWLTGGNS